ncbi:hypothetical protein JTB14_026565 [Gonioctena quinquepunctata]|nr:hypothetical protein JTB14_026565 [Gonioctena quinquepunctata]
MDTHQKSIEQEKKAEAKENALIQGKSLYVDLERADRAELEKKMEKEREEREKRQKLKEIRRKETAFHRANQAFNDLEFDIAKAARKWAKRTEEKLKEKHKTEKEDIPYEVLYGSSHEALFKHYQRKLTKKHREEFQTIKDTLLILTDAIEEQKNNEPPTQKGENKTSEKPKPKVKGKASPNNTGTNQPHQVQVTKIRMCIYIYLFKSYLLKS